MEYVSAALAAINLGSACGLVWLVLREQAGRKRAEDYNRHLESLVGELRERPSFVKFIRGNSDGSRWYRSDDVARSLGMDHERFLNLAVRAIMENELPDDTTFVMVGGENAPGYDLWFLEPTMILLTAIRIRARDNETKESQR